MSKNGSSIINVITLIKPRNIFSYKKNVSFSISKPKLEQREKVHKPIYTRVSLSVKYG
jgi:hypothetical protein